MPQTTFRPMTAEGAEMLGTALAKIDPWARYGYSAPALSAYLGTHEPDAPRYEIMTDQTCVGAIGVRRNWLRGPYLQFLGIIPAAQQRGIGSAALAWFETEARAGEAQNLWVAASEFNTRAIAFYEARGFVRVAALENLIADGILEILFRKRLRGV